MKPSFFLKLFAGYGLIVVLLATSLFVISLHIIRQDHIDGQIVQLERLANGLLPRFSPLIERGDAATIDALAKEVGQQLQVRITLIDADGVVLGDSEEEPAEMENHKSRDEVIRALYGSRGTSLRYSSTVRQTMLYVALPVRQADRITAVMRLSRYLTEIDTVLAELRRTILIATLLILLLALGVSALAARKLSDPARSLSEAARRVAEGDFSARVFLKNRDELADTAISFNQMAAKISEQFATITRQKAELDNILASMHEGLMVIGPDDRIELSNPSLRRILHSDDDGVGRFYWELLREPSFGELISAVRANEISEVHELQLKDKTFLCSTARIAHELTIAVVLLDISEIRNVERMKKDFVLNVSHELRTPLTAIKGFIDTMLEEEQQPQHAHYLQIIKRHTDRLINIVKDLMLLSNLERRPELELEPVFLKGLLEQSRKMYDQRLQEKNLTLRIESDAVRRPVMVDPFKIEQVFINLIDNAIKYTEQGGITVSLTHAETGVVVTVADTGIGIPPDRLDKIFERFYVVDKSRSRAQGGTGLGLSIVKHIILLHEGTIAVDSMPGEGTNVTVTLPYGEPPVES